MMAGPPSRGTVSPAGPAPAPFLVAGPRLLRAGDAPHLPGHVLDEARTLLARGGWTLVPGREGPWLALFLDDPVPAIALAPAPPRERIPGWVREWTVASRTLLGEAIARDPWLSLLATSPSLAPVLHPLARAAASTLPVLLGGESGTGKEVAVRALHAASGRRGPLVAENCAALPGPLLEAELFGVRRGAFTGAVRDRSGRFLAADGGTLFLDEIGDLPLAVQAKLLRVLEEGRVRPLGGDRPRPVDARIVAATRRDLRAMVLDGEFREDLYWRLAGMEVVLPPLRERRGDLPSLAAALLRRAAAEGLGPGRHLADGCLPLLESRPFPGNVRELFQVLRRAAVLSPGRRIARQTLEEALEGPSPSRTPLTLRGALVRHETMAILDALARAAGNKTRAARLLGWSRQRLYRRMIALGLRVPNPIPGPAGTTPAPARSAGRGAPGRESRSLPTAADTSRSG